MCKYSKLNLNTFVLSCGIAARWYTLTTVPLCNAAAEHKSTYLLLVTCV